LCPISVAALFADGNERDRSDTLEHILESAFMGMGIGVGDHTIAAAAAIVPGE
jgi:hypothetical protein